MLLIIASCHRGWVLHRIASFPIVVLSRNIALPVVVLHHGIIMVSPCCVVFVGRTV